jgi:hypothetical protein
MGKLFLIDIVEFVISEFDGYTPICSFSTWNRSK